MCARCSFSWAPATASPTVFTRAGFAAAHSERLSTELLYESGDAAADAAFAGGPVAMAYSRFDDPTRESARTDYIASIAQYRDGEAYRIPGEFVVTLAQRKNP